MVQPRSFSCASSIRAEGAGLDPRETRRLVDVDQASQPAEVDRDDDPRSRRIGLEAAGDVAAAAERDEHGVAADERGRRAPAPRPRCRGRPRGRGCAAASRRGTPDAGRAGSCRRCARRGRARRRSRRPRRRRRGRARGTPSSRDFGHVDALERRRARAASGVQVEPDGLDHERREAGLVLVVECDAGDAPAPPLHVRHVAHGVPAADPDATGCPVPVRGSRSVSGVSTRSDRSVTEAPPDAGARSAVGRSAPGARSRRAGAAPRRGRGACSPPGTPPSPRTRAAVDDGDRRPAALRPLRAARMGDVGADDRDRHAGHVGAGRERRGAGLELAHAAALPRVPSGNTSSGTPRPSRARASELFRSMPPRWIGKALKNSVVSPRRQGTSKK